VVGESWADLITQQHGVFTRAQATAHGISKATLNDRVADDVYRLIAPATYFCGGTAPLTREGELWAAVCSLRDADISHLTAGELHGLKVPADADVHVTVDPGSERRRSGVRVHRYVERDALDRTRRRGLPVTTVPRTVIDVFNILDDAEQRRAMVAEAFRRRRTTAARLQDAVLRSAQIKRRGELLYVVGLATGGSHSAGEMHLYELMRDWGLPEPSRQLIPELPRGRRYLDCALPTYKICLEYDGDLHLTDVQKHDDIIRDQTLRRLGWHTIRVTERRLRDERALARDIWADIVECAARLGVAPPMTPKRLK
jgi:hypothetical protein